MYKLCNQNNDIHRCALDLERQFHLEKELSSIGLIATLIPQQSTDSVEKHRHRAHSNYQIGEPTRDVSYSGHCVFFGDIASLPVFDYARYDFVQQTI